MLMSQLLGNAAGIADDGMLNIRQLGYGQSERTGADDLPTGSCDLIQLLTGSGVEFGNNTL